MRNTIHAVTSFAWLNTNLMLSHNDQWEASVVIASENHSGDFSFPRFVFGSSAFQAPVLLVFGRNKMCSENENKTVLTVDDSLNVVKIPAELNEAIPPRWRQAGKIIEGSIAAKIGWHL